MKKNAAVIGYGGMGAGFHVKNIRASEVVQLAGIYADRHITMFAT